MTSPNALEVVEELIARNAAAVEGLKRLYGFSDSEARYFMDEVEASAVDMSVDSFHVEKAA